MDAVTLGALLRRWWLLAAVAAALMALVVWWALRRQPSSLSPRAEPAPGAGSACPMVPRPPDETPRPRPPAVAGSWYPGERSALAAEVDRLLAAAPAPPSGALPLRALIAPHAGYRFSGAVAASAHRLLAGQPICRVIVMGPAHHAAFDGLSIAEVTHYRTPLGDIPLDIEAVARLRHHPLVQRHPEAHRREHSIEMQLPLLQRALGHGFSLVPILVGQLDADARAKAAALIGLLADEHTLLLASGDFTHYGPNYGYRPFPADGEVASHLRELDMGAFAQIEAHDADGWVRYRAETGITACAFGPVSILLDVLGDDVKTQLVRYDTSGHITGEYDNSVSYLAVAFRAARPLSAAKGFAQLVPASMRLLVKLAAGAVAGAVAGQEPDEQRLLGGVALPDELRKRGAAFVTLRKYGELRGCIGHLYPREPLYRSVLQNAVHAALHDRRFEPVRPAELPALSVEVSVLSAPKAIDSYRDFEVGKHGIILHQGGQRAVFLPEVAPEQGWSREQTLSHLARKAGLAAGAWREGASFEVFASQIAEAPWSALRGSGGGG